MSPKECLVLAFIFFCNVCAGMAFALQGPFFPKESERKGISPSVYGFVFGIFELVTMLLGVLIGSKIKAIGTKFVLTIGIVILGVSLILFSFLSEMPDSKTYIVFAFLIRIMESVGSVSVNIASYTAVTCLFPDKSASLGSWAETFYGIGATLGPSLGGVLYDAGGFKLPFQFVGGLLLMGLLFSPIFPNIRNKLSTANHSELSLWRAIKVPRLWCGILINSLGGMCSFCFLDVTLEPHVRNFQLSGSFLGLLFFLFSGGYTLSLPLWNRLSDNLVPPAWLIIIGAFLVAVGMSLIGPLPFLPYDTDLKLVISGLVVCGIGMGGEFVPSLVYIRNTFLDLGYANDVDTNGLVSGMWLSSFSLGGFIGPSIAGILYDFLGFRVASLLMVLGNILLMCTVVGFEIPKIKTTRTKSVEEASLLEKSLENGSVYKEIQVP